MKQRLFTPGPTPVPEEITLAMAAPLPHHRTPEFQETMRRTHELLQRVYRTPDPVVVLSASGTGAMEAAVVNLTHPGEKVLSVNGGKFGERWGALLCTFGRDVEELQIAWGESVTPEEIHDGLRRSGARIVFVTHSETSTAALCDLQQISQVTRDLDAVLVVDAITSLGAHRLETQRWGLGCVIGGSQKAFMMPPGLSFLSLSERARARIDGNPTPRYYFDLNRALKGVGQGRTPFTPAISLLLGLERSCQRILEEGLEPVWLRHQLIADAVRAGAAAMGLKPLATRPSNAVTAVHAPDGTSADAVRDTVWRRFGIKLAGGQGPLAGHILRIGHLGAYDAADVLQVLSALEEALHEHGHPVQPGAASAAARPFLGQLAAVPHRGAP
jgi:aspartate aminotransferase-like enzyme